tara:strand:+ start:98 stop:472 length:375 start_codon:yes stop_codon:yes gene_type:complete
MNREAIMKFADMYGSYPHISKKDLSKICSIISKSKANNNAEDQFMLFAATILQDKVEKSLDYIDNLIKMPPEKLEKVFPEINYLKNADLVIRSLDKPSERNQLSIIRMIHKVIRIYALSVNRFI